MERECDQRWVISIVIAIVVVWSLVEVSWSLVLSRVLVSFGSAAFLRVSVSLPPIQMKSMEMEMTFSLKDCSSTLVTRLIAFEGIEGS